MPTVAVLLCAFALSSASQPEVTARLQIQTGSWGFQSGEVSPDGQLFAAIAGGNQGTEPLMLWEIATGRQTLTFQAPPATILSGPGLAFTRDGKRLAALTQGGLGIWDVENGRLIKFEEGIADVDFSDDQAITVKQGRVSRYDLKTLTSVLLFECPVKTEPLLVDQTRSVACQPDGTAILFTNGQKTANIKFQRLPNYIAPCGPQALLVNLKEIKGGKSNDLWAVVDLKKNPPRVIEFEADYALAIKGGFFARAGNGCFLRRESDWTKSVPLETPADLLNISIGPDAQTVFYFGEKSLSRLDLQTLKLEPGRTYPEGLDWISSAYHHFVPGTSHVVATPFVGSSDSPAVIDLNTFKFQASLDSMAIGPNEAMLTTDGERLAVDYYPGDPDSVEFEGTTTWDLETGRALPPAIPGGVVVREVMPDTTVRDLLFHVDDRLVSKNLITGAEEEIFKSDLLTESGIRAKFTDLLILDQEVEVEREGETESIRQLILIPWQVEQPELTKIPYEFFADITRAPGSEMFWVCWDGKLLRFDAGTQNSDDFGEMPLPHAEDILKKYPEGDVQLIDQGLELAASRDNSTLLALSRAGILRMLGDDANDGVSYENFGSAQVFRAATKEWKRIDIGPSAPISGQITANGGTAYIATRDSRFLKCSTDDLKVQAELPLDSAGSSIALDEANGFAYVGTQSSINVFDLRNWKLAATLVVMRDGEWAVVAPDGRFDASRLDRSQGLYWIFSDQPNKPFPVEVLMRDYYEPRLLARIIAREPMSPLRPVTEVSRDLPVVAVLETRPAKELGRVDVRVSVDGTKTSAHDLKLIRNGQLVAEKSGQICPVGGRSEVWFEDIGVARTGADTVVFSAYAFNPDRAKSETATFTLPMKTDKEKGRAFVITVGVNSYDDRSWDLQFAASDAKASAAILEVALQASGEFGEVFTSTLLSDGDEREAHKGNFQTLMTELASEVRPEDTVVIHWAGHGYAAPDGQFYFITSDTGPSFDVKRPDDLKRVVSSDELSDWLRPIDAAQIVLIVDACHSAATVAAEGFKPGPMGARGLGQLAYDKGMIVLAATQTANFALESGEIGHGLLTFSLAVIGLLGTQEDGGLLYRTFSRDGKTASFRDLFDLTAILVPLLHEDLASGKRTLARTSRVTYKKDARAGAQKPQIFDFSRRKPRLVLAKGS